LPHVLLGSRGSGFTSVRLLVEVGVRTSWRRVGPVIALDVDEERSSPDHPCDPAESVGLLAFHRDRLDAVDPELLELIQPAVTDSTVSLVAKVVALVNREGSCLPRC
jgi:hypothetical protein